MAGPSVMVRILGDAGNLAKTFQTAGEKARGAAVGAGQAFGNMLNVLNRTGVLGPFGDALAQVQETMTGLAEHGKKASDVLFGAGAGLVGVGAGLSVLGSKEQAAHQQLAAAIAATGHSYDDYGKQIDEAIKHQERFGHTSEDTQGALQALTQATHNPAQALALLNEASDLAAAKHESLAAAATTLGKVYNGNTKLLKEYGIVVDKHTHLTKDGQTATQALAAVLAGQATAASDTFSGHLKALSVTIEDQTAKLGEKYGPALQGVGAALTGIATALKLGQSFMGLFAKSTEAATAATDAMAASEDAAAVSEGLALAPILLIVAAVAALGVAAYELYTHWNTVWAGIKAIVVDVWDWIKNNWPLLLGIITGPIGLATVEIVQHFNDIKNGVITVLSDIAGAIVYPFKAAFNGIADLWNNTVGSLHFHLPSWIPFMGGKGFDMPQIPHLAQGGLITQTGLVFAHAGEAITPIDKVPRGPAVQIQHAHFSSGVDVEAFMRRVAWTVQTQGV